MSLSPGAGAVPGRGRNPFDTHITVASDGGNVHLSWDRTAPAVTAATRGLLTITESGATKNVPLDATDLQAGTIVYHKLGSPVLFRLEFILSETASVVQSIESSGATAPARNETLP